MSEETAGEGEGGEKEGEGVGIFECNVYGVRKARF